MIYFRAADNGFYDDAQGTPPADSVAITDQKHMEIITGQNDDPAVMISADANGQPILVARPAPVIPPKTVFSSLEYLSKFTDAEYQAARTNTNMSVQRALDMLIAAQFVDIVNDPRVPGALDLMIQYCGMTPARKTELLTPQAA